MAAARRKKPPREDEQLVHAPSVRTITRWTFDRLRAAEIQADAGNYRTAAQVCEWLLTDDRVAGALSARSDALLGLDPTFEASGDKRRSNRAVKALEVQEDWWESYPESELDQFLSWGILLGAAPGIHRWQVNEDHDGRTLAYPEFWHPETLQQDQKTLQWSVQDSRGARLELTPGDGTWLLYTPFGKNRPHARGLWRSLKNWALLKQLAAQDFGIAGEKSRTVVGSSPETGTYAQRQQLANEIMASGSDAVILLAHGYELKALQLSAGTRELYESQIRLADAAIAIRIRGGNLTTEVKGDGGTRAATETQKSTGDTPKLKRDATTLSTFVHDQSLVWWAEFNYGDRNLAPWPVWPVEPEEDRKAKADTEEKAFANLDAAEKLGLEVDRAAFLDEYEIGWAKSGERPPEPVAEPAPEDESDDPPPAPPGNGSRQRPPAPAKARGSFGALLASGALAAANTGFVNGQVYTDAVSESATETAKNPLEQVHAAIREELDAATDYDDFRVRMTARYAELDPEEINQIVFAAMAMAELAGRVAVQEDV